MRVNLREARHILYKVPLHELVLQLICRLPKFDFFLLD